MKTSSDIRTLRRPSFHRFCPHAAAFSITLAGMAAAAPIAPSELLAPKIEIVGGLVNITIEPSVAGRIYQLQVSTDLTGTSWQNLENEVTGNGDNLSITTAHNPGVPRRFYRLKLADGDIVGFSLIPAGAFTMGRTSEDTDADAPPVTVNVSAFYMAKYEVTKVEWDEVQTWALQDKYLDLPKGAGKAANHPVHSLSWHDMVKWCNARSEKEGLIPVYTVSGVPLRNGTTIPTVNWSANGYRLPTEAEWEKAARGGVSGKRFPWGTDTISHSLANYYVYSFDGTANYFSYDVTPRPPATGTFFYHPTYAVGADPYSSPVGSFAPNGYGLYDMAGNMGEWCWDWYGELTYLTYANGTTDPRGAASGSYRLVRGGGWDSRANWCRASSRNYIRSDYIGYDVGFRLARSSIP